MIVRDTTYYSDLDFDTYLALPGVSYSSLKDVVITPTEGMKLGTRVHQYLNEPDKFDWVNADTVIPIAAAIRKYIGDAFHYLEKEVAFTSSFIHNDMMLQYKGRADMLKAGRIVIDVKVLAGSLEGAVKHFGYDRQVSGYCLATGAPLGLIVAYNKSKKIVEMKSIKPCAEFWSYQTVFRGIPI